MIFRSFLPTASFSVMLGIAALDGVSVMAMHSVAEAASGSGDLSPFRSITVDVASLVNTGDLASAKHRIKDLETSWDAAEAGLKPRDAKDWHKVDKAIDRALAAVRATPPDQKTCQAALASLLSVMDKVSSG